MNKLYKHAGMSENTIKSLRFCFCVCPCECPGTILGSKESGKNNEISHVGPNTNEQNLYS